MTLNAILSCALALQQLSIQPFPGAVGQAVTIRAQGTAGPLAGLPIQVELEGGVAQPVGATGADGTLVFTPQQPGYHVFAAVIDGVRNVAPVAIVPPRRRSWLALATVPLGLALLWSAFSRARGRRGP